MIDYEALCNEVMAVVRTVGDYIREEAGHFDAGKIEIKGRHDLVSYVDRHAEELLVATLVKLLPEAGFITEEKTIQKEGPEFTWIIDPLDGTTNFIQGIPVYSVSVALMEHDKLVLGVVYELGRDELFYAWSGGPAFLNGTVIQVSRQKDLDNSVIATGFPYNDFKQLDAYMQLMKQVIVSCRGLRRLGSAAVDIAYVACGRYEAYYEYNINSYDIAGGMFVLQQAGGIVTSFTGEASAPSIFKARQVLAANRFIHEKMLEAVDMNFNRFNAPH